MAKTEASSRYKAAYVNSPAGLRAFFVAVLLAAVMGVGFRLYFSPARLKSWVSEALQKAKKDRAFAISFEGAEMSLSHLGFPEIAVELSNIKIAPRAYCEPEASITIAKLRLPIRLRSLFIGRLAIGTVRADDIVVDLDKLRATCEATPPAPPQAPPVLGPRISVPGPKRETETVTVTSNTETLSPAPWWTPEQLALVRANVEGLTFSRAVLEFETRTKQVYLDSFSAGFRDASHLRLRTDLRIPPSVTYGETIPPLRFEGEATSLEAHLTISARVSEGSLQTDAVFTPGEQQSLLIDAKSDVRNLPLSMITPLLRKAGVVDQRFNPRFLWLGCQGSIKGRFQGLFQTSPFHLENCRIEGDGSRVTLNEASRHPNGTWSPFTVQVDSLNVGKLLDTMGVKGPDAVVSKYGSVRGEIRVEPSQAGTFRGTLADLEILFSSRNSRATQKVTSARIEVDRLAPGLLKLSMSELKLANGEATARLAFELDTARERGSLNINLDQLVLDPSVQKVLTSGVLGPIQASGSAQMSSDGISAFNLDGRIGLTETPDYRFRRLDFKLARGENDRPVLSVATDAFDLNRASNFYRALSPTFFKHVWANEDAAELNWLALSSVSGRFSVLENQSLSWSELSARIEKRVQLKSLGTMSRERVIDGTLTLNYPKVQNLKWKISGQLDTPTLEALSEVKKFESRVETDDAALGL